MKIVSPSRSMTMSPGIRPSPSLPAISSATPTIASAAAANNTILPALSTLSAVGHCIAPPTAYRRGAKPSGAIVIGHDHSKTSESALRQAGRVLALRAERSASRWPTRGAREGWRTRGPPRRRPSVSLRRARARRRGLLAARVAAVRLGKVAAPDLAVEVTDAHVGQAGDHGRDQADGHDHGSEYDLHRSPRSPRPTPRSRAAPAPQGLRRALLKGVAARGTATLEAADEPAHALLA